MLQPSKQALKPGSRFQSSQAWFQPQPISQALKLGGLIQSAKHQTTLSLYSHDKTSFFDNDALNFGLHLIRYQDFLWWQMGAGLVLVKRAMVLVALGGGQQ